jgi:hypothetical protein
MGGRPSIGSVVARLQGPVDPSVPPFIGLAERTQHVPWSDPGQPGFLGPTFAAFRPSGPDMANMVLNVANRDHLPERKPCCKPSITSSGSSTTPAPWKPRTTIRNAPWKS